MSGPLLPNIPGSEAPDRQRVARMSELVSTVLGILDPAVPVPTRELPKLFLLRVAWHEGDRLLFRQQHGNGPARSLFQFEAHRARDAGDYARARGWLGTLAQLCATTESSLGQAFSALPLYNSADPNSSARFPAGNQVEVLLSTYDAFGIALARIAFKKVPDAIPTSIDEQAAYWYTHWNRGPNPAAQRANFVQHTRTLDGLLTA